MEVHNLNTSEKQIKKKNRGKNWINKWKYLKLMKLGISPKQLKEMAAAEADTKETAVKKAVAETIKNLTVLTNPVGSNGSVGVEPVESVVELENPKLGTESGLRGSINKQTNTGGQTLETVGCTNWPNYMSLFFNYGYEKNSAVLGNVSNPPEMSQVNKALETVC